MSKDSLLGKIIPPLVLAVVVGGSSPWWVSFVFKSDSNQSTTNATSPEESGKGEWMSSAQYQQEFNTKSQNGFYPILVEGKCQNDGEKFHAEWKTIPPGTSFASRHGINKETYESANSDYVSQSYFLEFMNTFKDCTGGDRYQATWIKR
jgi:hypothetical protein